MSIGDMIVRVRAGTVGPGERVTVSAGASVRDIDRGRYFAWQRGGTVQAWPDPPHGAELVGDDPPRPLRWLFRLGGSWCVTQAVYVTPAPATDSPTPHGAASSPTTVSGR